MLSNLRPKRVNRAKLLEYAARVLGSRALSKQELRDRLAQRAEDPADVDGVMARLEEAGYLNDQRFAEGFAAARKENQGFGKLRVLRDLRQRKVTGEVAAQAAERAFDGTDEEALIEQYLEKKYRSRNLTDYLADERHLAAAFRRLRTAGFRAGAAIRVLKRYAERADELEDEPEAG